MRVHIKWTPSSQALSMAAWGLKKFLLFSWENQEVIFLGPQNNRQTRPSWITCGVKLNQPSAAEGFTKGAAPPLGRPPPNSQNVLNRRSPLRCINMAQLSICSDSESPPEVHLGRAGRISWEPNWVSGTQVPGEDQDPGQAIAGATKLGRLWYVPGVRHATPSWLEKEEFLTWEFLFWRGRGGILPTLTPTRGRASATSLTA